MNPNLPTQAIDTDQYLTVGALLEKIQFDDLSNRIAVCVENPEATTGFCAMTATPGKTFAMNWTTSLRGKRRTLPINPPRRGMGGVQNATIQTATTLSGVFPHRKGDS
jgi:hypothetical protein